LARGMVQGVKAALEARGAGGGCGKIPPMKMACPPGRTRRTPVFPTEASILPQRAGGGKGEEHEHPNPKQG
jgi:hypothetical protein